MPQLRTRSSAWFKESKALDGMQRLKLDHGDRPNPCSLRTYNRGGLSARSIYNDSHPPPATFTAFGAGEAEPYCGMTRRYGGCVKSGPKVAQRVQ